MKKLFVVDDYADLHDIIYMIFEDDDVEVKSSVTADNIFENMMAFEPDLILLDIKIGEIDGRDLCRSIKSSKRFKHIPVVLMSALNVDLEDSTADAYFEKPFEVEHVRSLVLTLINQSSESSLLIN